MGRSSGSWLFMRKTLDHNQGQPGKAMGSHAASEIWYVTIHYTQTLNTPTFGLVRLYVAIKENYQLLVYATVTIDTLMARVTGIV